MQGLSAVNYDIDISDTSADSSAGVSPHPSFMSMSENKEGSPDIANVQATDPASLLDTSESPTSKLLLPSPIKPVAPELSTDLDKESLLEEQSPTPVRGQGTDGHRPSQVSTVAASSNYQSFTAQGWKIQSIPCDTGTSDLSNTNRTKKAKKDMDK